ncbi:4-hydroxy-2-oxovalerate aldolase [Sulfobacillus acidophilus TPY]|uniref:4-hydroxy-2-oxovalerate aldolase n=1 Tax=Sulfobacillus acidophilus (strain ATCC 700253 / DSM 10332 / NAL) TaxID=679936 RepID=G8U0B5_SULAD|nr:4-hydroxy-2-oxovalerate aldolase [Sulfobacillus acidophilus TPY]AEW06457.1 4-hydroxy-2-oxovalerate aldolase [Sulfobacillus acidophilus DSM 10332]
MTHTVRVTDVTLRDGMHAVRHQFSVEDVRVLARAIDQTGVAIIEASHGDGLGGHSRQYGRAKETEADFLRAVVESVEHAKVAALLLPGIGTVAHLKQAAAIGIQVVRIATHCTEADIAEQHMEAARKLGLEVVGFLMMAHMVDPDVLVGEARKMASYGAQCVYVVDSAGAMVMEEARTKVAALRDALPPEVEVGFHAHHNLGLSVANSVVAVEAGAARIDASVMGLGAGAGNTPLEVFAAVTEKMGWDTALHLYAAMDATPLVKERLIRPIEIDRLSLTMGFAGVYSSFLLHAFRVAEQFGVDGRDILVELGKRRVVGGQEDMITDVAYQLARKNAEAAI